MKRVAYAAVLAACVSMSGTAFAADLSLKDTPDYAMYPSTIWTGLYVGGHIGGSWSDADISDVNELNTVDPHADVTISRSDVLFGAQIGYNRQRGNLVYGLEADIGQMKLDGTSATQLMQEEGAAQKDGRGRDVRYGLYDRDCDGYGDGSNNRSIQQCRLESKYSVSGGLYGDLTGRVGYANDKALFYLKGGAAFLNVDVNARYTAQHNPARDDPDGIAQFDFSKSETMWGWTIGAGVEYAISRSLSLKAEYQHFDFGTMDMSYEGAQYRWCNGSGHCAGSTTIVGDSETDVTVDAVSVGLNYHFNGSADPLK
jgi:outer membrane immunogenic protein